MFSHSQKIIIGDIIQTAASRWYDISYTQQDGFLKVKLKKAGHIIVYDESTEKLKQPVRRYFFLKKILKNLSYQDNQDDKQWSK